MDFVGIDPGLARDLSATMRQGSLAADGLSGEVEAILTLSELTSEAPRQLIITGDEMEKIGVIVAARADIAEGFVIDPATLAADVGLPVGVVEKALAEFEEPEADAKALTPLLDAVVETATKAEELRTAFLDLPSQGEDPELDTALLELARWLPAALEKDKVTGAQARTYADALQVLAGALGLKQTSKKSKSGFLSLIGGEKGDRIRDEILGNKLFERIEKVFELDQRVAKAAELPRIKDILYELNRDLTDDLGIFVNPDDIEIDYDEDWDDLDDILPAVLVGELELPDDQALHKLVVDFADAVGFKGSDIAGAIEFLRGERLVQKALIPGDFEAIDGPVIIWNNRGVETSLKAGRRNGVLTDRTFQVANLVAENVLVDLDGTDEPIELSDEQQQALVAAIAAQNGQEFVTDSDNIQRQIVSAINLIGRQDTLTEQRTAFAKAIEAFRSLAVVGSPSLTYRRLKKVVGEDVDEELSYKYLTSRSEKATTKRPQFLVLVSHWGIPGGDKIKLKKHDFTYEFGEDGSLEKVKQKKLSKWKRFKRTVKAIGKSIWKEWKKDPWKYLFLGPAGLLPGANQLVDGIENFDFEDIVEGTFDMAKTAANIAAFVFPGTTGLALTAAGLNLIEAIDEKDTLGILSSGFAFVGGAAGLVDDAANIGSTANLVKTGAKLGSSVIGAVDAGIDFADAIDDGNILGALGSGFSLIGNAAGAVANGAEFANSAGAALNGKIISPKKITGLLNDGLAADAIENDFTHTVVSKDTIGAIDDFGANATDLGNLTTGAGRIVDAVDTGNITGIAEGVLDIVQVGTDADSALGKGLAVADEALDIVGLAESGQIPEYGALFNEFVDVGRTGVELGRKLGAKDPGVSVGGGPLPTVTVGPDGSKLVDYDNDGIIDAEVTVDERGNRVIGVDVDGDGITDETYVDTNGDGTADSVLVDHSDAADHGDATNDGLVDPKIRDAAGDGVSQTGQEKPTPGQERIARGEDALTGNFLVETAPGSNNTGKSGEVVLVIGGYGEAGMRELGGSGAVADGLLPELDRSLEGADVGHVYWDHGQNGAEWIEQYKAANPDAKVTIIGHSYGGEAAMDVAAMLGDDIKVDVVTLDPVSHFRRERPDNVESWDNVYVDGWNDFTDSIADIGGQFGSVDTGGGINTPAGDGVAHGDVMSLYRRLERVRQATEQATQGR